MRMNFPAKQIVEMIFEIYPLKMKFYIRSEWLIEEIIYGKSNGKSAEDGVFFWIME